MVYVMSQLAPQKNGQPTPRVEETENFKICNN